MSDTSRQTYGRLAARGGMIGLGGFAATQAVNLATYVVLGRLISPAEMGVFAAGSLITGIGILFAESGMLAALVTRQEEFQAAASTAFIWNIVSGLGLAILALALSPVAGIVFHSREVAEVSAAMSGILWIKALGVAPDSVLQRRLSFARRIAIDPLAMVAFAVVAISTTTAGAGVWGLVFASYASIATRTLGTWGFAHWRPQVRSASMRLLRELIAFSRSVVLSEAIRHLVASLDVLLIGRFVGAAPLGQYRYGQRVASQPGAAWVGAGAYVVLPVFARLADDGPRLRAACLKVLRWMAILLFPVAIALSAFGPTIATLVFGREWRTAGWALMALVGVSIGQGIVSVASETFKVARRPIELARVHGLSALVIAACMLALLPAGMIGVAGGLSLGWCIVAAYAVRRLQTVVGLSARAVLRELTPPFVVAATVSAIGYGVEASIVHADLRGVPEGLLALSAELLLIWATYAVILCVFLPEVRDLLTPRLSWIYRHRPAIARKAEGT